MTDFKNFTVVLQHADEATTYISLSLKTLLILTSIFTDHLLEEPICLSAGFGANIK